MANPFTIIRNKFADDLEEILQCSICFELLKEIVPLCIGGHSVCNDCRSKLAECPFCKSPYYGSRNYLAENLIQKFSEIKISLLDPENRVNKTVVKGKMSIGIQTGLEGGYELTPLIRNVNNERKEHEHISPPIQGKGNYPCCISDCCAVLPHGRMVAHAQEFHANQLIEESKSVITKYTKSFTLQYILSADYQWIINLPSMGIFYFKIIINEQGHLSGIVQIVNTQMLAEKYDYSIEIGNSLTTVIHRGKVTGCRISSNANQNKKKLFIEHSFMKHIISRKVTLECNLTISRND